MNFNHLELSKTTLKKYIQFFHNNGNYNKKEKVSWQFFDNGLKNNFSIIAHDNGENKEAGVYAMSIVRFKSNNNHYKELESKYGMTFMNMSEIYYNFFHAK